MQTWPHYEPSVTGCSQHTNTCWNTQACLCSYLSLGWSHLCPQTVGSQAHQPAVTGLGEQGNLIVWYCRGVFFSPPEKNRRLVTDPLSIFLEDLLWCVLLHRLSVNMDIVFLSSPTGLWKGWTQTDTHHLKIWKVCFLLLLLSPPFSNPKAQE